MKLWTVLILMFCAGLRADPPQPEVLYHWASFSNLKRVSKANRGRDGYPIDTIWDGQWLSMTYPELMGKPGIYTWTHPATGLTSDMKEIYGGDALVKIRLKPGLKTAEVRSKEGAKSQALPEGAKDAQLLLHKRFTADGRLIYQEWVLLDPNAVDGYSALPTASRAEIEREIENLGDPTHRYSDEQLHYLDPDGQGKSSSVFNEAEHRKEIRGYLRRFLSADLRSIPPRFRRDLNEPLTKCSGAYGDAGGGS